MTQAYPFMPQPHSNNIVNDVPPTPAEGLGIIEDTWRRLGKKMRGHGYQVVIRTDRPCETTKGGVYLTEQQRSFYYNMPNVDVPGREAEIKKAVVLSPGHRVTSVKAGDRILIPRGWFARYEKLDDGSYVGWINECNIWAVIEGVDEGMEV